MTGNAPLVFIRYTASQLRRRYMAVHRYNYILPSGKSDRYTLYYDENTTRNERFEYNCRRAGFQIIRLIER